MKFIKQIFINFPNLLFHCLSLLIPVIIFVLFVIYNGSIVVGDKENHKPVLHFAMPIHLLAISGLFTLNRLFLRNNKNSKIIVNNSNNKVNKVSNSLIKKIQFLLSHLIGVSIVTSCLYYGSLSHPFLLADNR